MKKLLLIFPLILSFMANSFAADFVYKPASKDEIAGPLQKVEGTQFERFLKPYEIQRLSQNVYWVSTVLYNVTVIVGYKSVLVIDAPLGREQNLLDAIAEITSKPIRAIVYSHAHKDHIGGAGEIINKLGPWVKVMATEEVYDEIITNKMDVPRPDVIIEKLMFFEGIFIWALGNMDGHSIDNTAFIIKDGGRSILHAIDILWPDSLPFVGFGLSENVTKYELDFKYLLELNFDVMTTGHSNIGYKEDILINLKYYADVKAAVLGALPKVDFGDFVEPGGVPFVWFVKFKDSVLDKALDSLAAKYREGREDEFDALARTHLEAFYWTTVVR